MKNLKRTLWIILTMMVVFFIFLLWYKNRYSMDVVESYEVNSPNLEKKLLIATQGSEFKDMLTQSIVDHYTSDAIYIKVIDVSSLENIAENDYTAILVIHTWENWKPPVEVKAFVENTKPLSNKIVVMTTSGEGSYKMEGIDAITGESKVGEVPFFEDRIANRLDALLKPND